MSTEQETASNTFLANDMIKLLREHDKSRFITRLEEDLHELVKAVKVVGKKGKMTISISINPEGDDVDEVEQVTVKTDVSLSLPRPSTPSRVYFTTKEDGLSRSHPDQLSFLPDHS